MAPVFPGDELDVQLGSVSYYKINPDGTYEDADVNTDVVYLHESQIAKLADREIAQYVREKYGPYVCIVHTSQVNLHPPVYPTYKFILGG